MILPSFPPEEVLLYASFSSRAKRPFSALQAFLISVVTIYLSFSHPLSLSRLKTALKLILNWFFNSTRGRETAGYVSRSFSHTFLDPIAPTREGKAPLSRKHTQEALVYFIECLFHFFTCHSRLRGDACVPFLYPCKHSIFRHSFPAVKSLYL